MTEVQEGISKATTLSSARNEDNRRVNAEFIQELHSISDRLDALPDIGREQLLNLQSLVGMFSDLQLEMRTQRQNSPSSTRMEAFLTDHDRCNKGETSLTWKSNEFWLESVILLERSQYADIYKMHNQ